MSKAEFRIRSLLLSLLVIGSWQISGTAIAQMAIISRDGTPYSSLATSSSTPTKYREHAKPFGDDGIDCTASKDEENQPLQGGVNFPDAAIDLDDSDGGLDDFCTGRFANVLRPPPYRA